MSKTEFITVGEPDLPRYAERILLLEQEFDEMLRAGYEDLLDGVRRPNPVSFALLIDNDFAGYAIAYPLENDEIDEYGLEGLYSVGSVYFESMTLDPAHRGKGYGNLIFAECVRRAREAGYRFLVGHFRPNGSLSSARKLGSKDTKVAVNWKGTGEDYVYGVIDLAAAR
jgi:GNAT superfamily N-acetyltransferase